MHPWRRTPSPQRGRRRPRLALVLALVALAAALVGALGPADVARTTYAWPPQALPDETPSRLWYSPLLLVRQRPESLTANLPCSTLPALAAARSPTVVLATARSAEAQGGLAVTSGAGELVLAVGDRVLDRIPLSEGTDRDAACSYRLRLERGRWSLEGGPGQVLHEGDLESMPFVTGLFSALDLRSGKPPSVEVTTAVHDVQPTVRQKTAWTLAALAIAAALLLVAIEGRPRRPGLVITSAVRAGAARAHPADGLVVAVLLVWWVLSPSYWDDGWIAARLASYADTGSFSTYYDVLGASNPLGYWLDWAQHSLLWVSDALLVLRVPALTCLTATWLVCRYVLGRELSAASGGGAVALWALASAFLLGALAWGMTVRPEPVLALIVTGVAACAVRFLDRGTAAPVALAAVLIPLALSVHPAGLVALAPLLYASPRLFMWARHRLTVAAAIAVAAIALLAVLLFVGSDLEQRGEDSRTFEAFGTSAITWRDEAVRYERLSEFPFATPVRRAWVALALLAALAFLLRRRRNTRMLDLGGATLTIGLALLVATPSKWGWHFGALLGIAAVAVASETAHLRNEAARSSEWRTRPFLFLGATMVAAAWSWSPRTAWALLDLRTLDWILGVEAPVSLSKLTFLLPPLLLAGTALFELARRGRSRLPETPWRVAAWTGPILAAPAIAFTLALLVADNAKTDAWTLARQNLDTSRFTGGCGLADDLLAAAPASQRPPEPLTRRLQGDTNSSFVLPELRMYFPCIRQPRFRDGVVEVPHAVVAPFDSTSWLSNWAGSPFRGLVDLYPLERLSLAHSRHPPRDVAVFQVERGIPGAALAPATRRG